MLAIQARARLGNRLMRRSRSSGLVVNVGNASGDQRNDDAQKNSGECFSVPDGELRDS